MVLYFHNERNRKTGYRSRQISKVNLTWVAVHLPSFIATFRNFVCWSLFPLKAILSIFFVLVWVHRTRLLLVSYGIGIFITSRLLIVVKQNLLSTPLFLFLQKRAYSDGNPNATISPLLLGVDPGLPVVTINIPCPNDGPAVPNGDPTLNSQSFLPVSASNAITIHISIYIFYSPIAWN